MKLLLSITLFLFFLQFTYSQTDKQRREITSKYDIQKLSTLKKNFSKIYKIEKQKALAYALENNIEPIKTNLNGGISILEKVLDDGTLTTAVLQIH